MLASEHMVGGIVEDTPQSSAAKWNVRGKQTSSKIIICILTRMYLIRFDSVSTHLSSFFLFGCSGKNLWKYLLELSRGVLRSHLAGDKLGECEL